ncbi:DUF3850 domain-containing protein [Anaerostipes hadrus]|jgi:uncharacterized protein YnzC (UPF0291/DUF896 family)|uniref:Activating signal cointegrator n=1 Tax=Siphoviridae sp. ctuvi3 TaxID=2825718 RepID=A0A8S5TZP1_9CAUD|nr:ASCH/PUA domain-containing protein [Anaerostipes hadrus]NSH14242.1 DUF3850 domain-containing protein [Anaerostipes hadrus]NSH37449.1 DUF3850 domain-containing protein [Anaerostipes hadrus]NSH49032.1 DUF3850 domain-containing protein [Anaerostipes hadrus]DAF87647.1 MAG TPA: activating signal cointegrator [Siphoviridae sp. ctuvi3]
MEEYHQITLNEYISIKEDIKRRLNHLAESFVAIGYRLKQIRDTEAYRQDGYNTIFEFAEKELGLTKSPTSRFMAINDKYSVGGNSLELREEFIGLGKSRLSEMLTMDPEDYVLITAQTSIKDIREIKRMEKAAGENEVLTKFQEVLRKEYASKDRRKELIEIANAKCIDDIKAAVIPEGYRLMKKGVLVIKFEDEKITVRTMGVSGVQELTWSEILSEYDQAFDLGAADPWKATYGEIEEEVKPEPKKVEKKPESKKPTKAESKPVATSQQEEQVVGRTSIEKDFPEYLPEDLKVEIEQTNKVEVPETVMDDRRHKLKLAKMFFEDVRLGRKSFELRKNDRDYQIGDILELREMDNGEPTGRVIEKEITYILEGFAGLKEDYCILALADI